MSLLYALPHHSRSQHHVRQVGRKWLQPTVCPHVGLCARALTRVEVVSGEMSFSDYRLRQFSNYSVKHQSWGLTQAVLWPDGQCNHQRAPSSLSLLCLFTHPCPAAALSIKLLFPHHGPPRPPNPTFTLLVVIAPLLLRHLVLSPLLATDTFHCKRFHERGDQVEKKMRCVRGMLTMDAAVGGKII